jgi:hypothetical protein
MGRRKKFLKLMNNRERVSFGLGEMLLEDSDQSAAALKWVFACQITHEHMNHQGEPCMESRIALVSGLAVQLGIESVEEFAEVEMMAAKIRQGIEVETHGR